MKLYAVIETDGYIPYVEYLTPDKEEAIKRAKESSEGWNNELADSIYFNQREEGSMEYSITVQEVEVK